MDWEAIKSAWPVALLFGGHVIRTERQRAVFAEKHKQAEKEATEMKKMLTEIRADIKHLLERDR